MVQEHQRLVDPLALQVHGFVSRSFDDHERQRLSHEL